MAHPVNVRRPDVAVTAETRGGELHTSQTQATRLLTRTLAELRSGLPAR